MKIKIFHSIVAEIICLLSTYLLTDKLVLDSVLEAWSIKIIVFISLSLPLMCIIGIKYQTQKQSFNIRALSIVFLFILLGLIAPLMWIHLNFSYIIISIIILLMIYSLITYNLIKIKM